MALEVHDHSRSRILVIFHYYRASYAVENGKVLARDSQSCLGMPTLVRQIALLGLFNVIKWRESKLYETMSLCIIVTFARAGSERVQGVSTELVLLRCSIVSASLSSPVARPSMRLFAVKDVLGAQASRSWTYDKILTRPCRITSAFSTISSCRRSWPRLLLVPPSCTRAP